MEGAIKILPPDVFITPWQIGQLFVQSCNAGIAKWNDWDVEYVLRLNSFLLLPNQKSGTRIFSIHYLGGCQSIVS